MYQLYCEDGVKSILISMMTEWPDIWLTRAEACSKRKEDEINKDSLDWALSQIYRWKQKNWTGNCPPFSWRRSEEKFWSLVNVRQPDSRKKSDEIGF